MFYAQYHDPDIILVHSMSDRETHENLELHTQYIDTTAAAVSLMSIRWVVLHAWDMTKNLLSNKKNYSEINTLLSQLPHLEKITLETDDMSRSNETAELLADVTDKIQRWSHHEAKSYADEARRNGAPSSDQLPISSTQCVNIVLSICSWHN